MASPVQNPGYIPGEPANTNENDQLNQLESDGSYGTPTPAPDPTPDSAPDPAASADPS